MPDVHFVDSRPVSWLSPGGQLFWGHALYVARDVVEGSAGWQRLLRAGALGAALGLPDLATHAWRKAAASAPRDQAEAIVAATAGP